MSDKEIVLETMKKAGEPVNAGKVAEMSGLDIMTIFQQLIIY